MKSLRQLVASLSGGQRQTVAIAKAVLWNSRLVILDEPTAALGVAQTAQVLELVRRLADNGLAVVLISHNMNDVFAVSDRIAALYLGRMVAQVKTTDVTHSQIVELITAGRSGDLGLPPENGGNGAGHADSSPREPTNEHHHHDRGARGAGARTDPHGQRATSATTRPGTRRRHRRAAGRPRPDRALHSSSAIARPDVLHRRSTSPTCSPRAPRSSLIAMGLVFVLLLGEIDLSAGFASGVCAAVLADPAHQRTAGPGTSPCSPPSSPAW